MLGCCAQLPKATKSTMIWIGCELARHNVPFDKATIAETVFTALALTTPTAAAGWGCPHGQAKTDASAAPPIIVMCTCAVGVVAAQSSKPGIITDAGDEPIVVPVVRESKRRNDVTGDSMPVPGAK